jgi:hypothetical protein
LTASALAKGSRLPSIWLVEVSNRLLMAMRRKRITAPQVEAFLDRLAALNIVVDPPLVPTSEGSIRPDLSLTFYDAAYLELATDRNLHSRRWIQHSSGLLGFTAYRSSLRLAHGQAAEPFRPSYAYAYDLICRRQQATCYQLFRYGIWGGAGSYAKPLQPPCSSYSQSHSSNRTAPSAPAPPPHSPAPLPPTSA